MTEKRFRVVHSTVTQKFVVVDNEHEEIFEGIKNRDTACRFSNLLNALHEENKQLKAQLYCDDEEGICNICKHHYLVKDDETEFGYYNSRCRKGHYECARVSLKHCEDFEKELEE